MAGGGTLLIDAGDLPSLVVAALQGRPAGLVLYHPRGSDPAAGRRESAARWHAEALGVERVLYEPLGTVVGGDRAVPLAEDLVESALLMRAAAVGAAMGCNRVLSPRQVGPDPQLVSQAAERAGMVGALAQLGCPPGAAERVSVDLPVVDLTDPQLADLADELGAPLKAFWPCTLAGEHPCARCDGCRRWSAAFRDAGVAWPWAQADALVGARV